MNLSAENYKMNDNDYEMPFLYDSVPKKCN